MRVYNVAKGQRAKSKELGFKIQFGAKKQVF